MKRKEEPLINRIEADSPVAKYATRHDMLLFLNDARPDVFFIRLIRAIRG
jgi:hypothetical protein